MMVWKAASVLAFLFLVATPGLQADTVIQMSVGGDVVALPGRLTPQSSCQPCVDPPKPGDLISLSAADDRIRRDRGPMSIILRKDSKRIYFLCKTSKQYTELPYPVKHRGLARKTSLPASDDLLRFDLTAPGATGRSQVNQWQVETFDGIVANGLRNQFRVHVAVADLGGAGGALILEFTKLLNELQHSGLGWSRLLPFERGVPVIWEEAQRQPETEFVYREEVTAFEDRQVSPGTYEVPADYKKVKFEPECLLFR